MAEVQRWRRTLTLFMPALLLRTHKTCTHCSQTCCRRSCGKAFASCRTALQTALTTVAVKTPMHYNLALQATQSFKACQPGGLPK